LQYGGFPTISGSTNKINMACQAAMDDDVFDKLRFVNEIGTPVPLAARGRSYSVQDTGAVIHGEHSECGRRVGWMSSHDSEVKCTRECRSTKAPMVTKL
jgi:hypothetical protein